jgi:DNA-binding response OmpR family regulator
VNILIVEDDEGVARSVERALLVAGHRAAVARDGASGLAHASSGSFDVILLDILLPELDGITVCRALREQHVRTPILMLTARDTVSDRVNGLDAGADDYLSKPFATEELLARIRALVRRGSDETDGSLRVGDLVLNAARHEVQRGDRPIDLTPREFEVLEYLMRHAGQVITRDQIIQNIGRASGDVSPKSVDLYIHYLRNKIDRETAWPLVRTIRGVGYMIDG